LSAYSGVRHRAAVSDSTRWAAVIGVVAAAGIAMRVYVWRSTLGIPDSDEAVVGLMARHAAQGHFTVFFWGQSYGGSQEAILAAPLVWLFGDSWTAIRVVPIALQAAACLLIWRAGLRLIGEPGARVAGALFWIWPPYAAYYISRAFAFYGTDVFYCSLLLLLALRIVERPDRLRVGLFGLALGLAFWQTSQIVPIALPLIAWTLWKQPKAVRHLPVAAGLLLLGALPWIVWNLRHDFGSLTLPSAGSSTYAHRLRIYVSPLVPMILGLRIPYTEVPVAGPGAGIDAVYVALAALFLFGAWRARRRQALVLYAIVAVFPFLYAISPLTLNAGEPRYLIVVTPVVVLILGELATTYWRGVALLAVAGALSAIVLHRTAALPRLVDTPFPKAPRNLAPLVATLDRLGLDRVYANYWVAYALNFDTSERIVADQSKLAQVRFVDGEALVPRDPYIRFPGYDTQVAGSPMRGFVLFKSGLDTIPIVPALRRDGYRSYPVGPFIVLAPPG
jgi:hypothetical protein